MLESDPDTVVTTMNTLRDGLWTPERMHVQVVGDLGKLPEALAILTGLTDTRKTAATKIAKEVRRGLAGLQSGDEREHADPQHLGSRS